MKNEVYDLIITLKADLCAGSGYSYAGIIDSDLCYDDLGIPYLTARRLKGCLREAAELIGYQKEEIESLFGKRGEDNVKGLMIGNAYPDQYETMRMDIQNLGEAYRMYLTPQNILGQFTSVKAQTRIEENGAAMDNSLRFTRTVNHYSPLEAGEKEMCFTARVVLPASLDETAKKMWERSVMALRSIGMNRNRGMGSVRCKAVPVTKPEPDGKVSDTFGVSVHEIQDDTVYTLRYSVRNTSPLILSMSNDEKTERYISGRIVRGFFAGAYLRETGKTGEDEMFRKLFVRGNVCFGALYPAQRCRNDSDVDDGFTVYYPAPAYINRLKKTKRYVNVSKKLPRDKGECIARSLPLEYACGYGNQPKRLKDKFVCRTKEGISVQEPAVDIIYHHTKKSKKPNAKNGNLLYTSEVLRSQQLFSGEITGKGEDLKILIPYLLHHTLRFGKSRSAQYGSCELAGVPCLEPEKMTEHVYQKNSEILVVLESDGLFFNDFGYTVRCQEVREQIKKQLGIVAREEEQSYSELTAGVLTGYYAKWNLKRSAVPVVKAGSTFAFRLAEDWRPKAEVLWIGENNGEGFGRVRIQANGNSEEEDCRIVDAEKRENTEAKQPQCLCGLFQKILLEEARERLMLQATQQNLHFPNAASLGRVTLMLAESLEQFPEDYQQSYKDYCQRIDSIKTKEIQQKAKKLLSDLIGKPDQPDGLKYYTQLKDLERLYDELAEDTGTFVEQAAGLWGDYLMAVLVQEKYNLKKAEQKSEEVSNEEN